MPRKIYQRGATSLQWTAEDRNGDKLVYDVFYKQVGDTQSTAAENIDDNFLTIDGQSLADGRYIFKVVAKDSPSNPARPLFPANGSTDPIDIDNTPPIVTPGQPRLSTAISARVTFAASDKASYLTRAEYSVNGGDWQPVYADDGISDSPDERYTVEVPIRPPANTWSRCGYLM